MRSPAKKPILFLPLLVVKLPVIARQATMEEEDDDFYDPTDVVPVNQAQTNANDAAPGEPQDGIDMEDEEVEFEDDDVRN